MSIWNGIEPRKRPLAVLAALAVALVGFGLFRAATAPSMALLYSGLDPAAAGGVAAALEARATPFEVRGDSIYVPQPMRDETRIALAAEGQPANGPAGYELLDELSGFGTTSEMFDATYWRAKEGELARTILAAPGVRSARVHIANPVRRPFERGSEASASVTVTLATGALDRNRAGAFRYLVASAVAGLRPESVAVIDGNGGVVLRAGEGGGAGLDTDPNARAAALRANVERLLAARVGIGSAIVEVMVDTDMDSETITERVLDPQSRVAISTDTEENSEDATGVSATGVTVASNLPDGDVEGGSGGDSTRSAAQTRERVNYEVSEIRRERVRRPGQIRRISVAVLVDEIATTGPDGEVTFAPRPDGELESLRTLVESTIGFDPARGDVVTIESLRFSRPEGGEARLEGGFASSLADNAAGLIQTAVLALVALALGLFVLRPMLTGAPARNEELTELSPIESLNAITALDAAGEIVDQEESAQATHIRSLRSAIDERPEDSLALLRNWLDGGDEDNAKPKELAA